MGNYRRLRKLFSNPVDTARGKLDMDVTGPLPKIHLSSCPLHHPCAEILVRDEENVSISRRAPNNFFGISAGTNDIGKGFDSGAAIDVGDHVIILLRVLLKKCL